MKISLKRNVKGFKKIISWLLLLLGPIWASVCLASKEKKIKVGSSFGRPPP